MAVTISLSITQNSQNVIANTSNVTVKVTAIWSGGSYNVAVSSDGTPQANGSLTINGTSYTFNSKFNTGQTKAGSAVIFTKTVNVPHNADGTKTLSCSAWYNTYVSSGKVSASASKALTTIAVKSTLSVANGTLGTTQTLTITRKSSKYYHDISYTCGTANGYVDRNVTTTASFTPPLSLASQNTTGTTVSITFKLVTYNSSGTSIGYNTYTRTYSMPASIKPTVKTVALTDPMGYVTRYGGYVQGYSKVKAVITATTSYSSPISSYSYNFNGGNTFVETAGSYTSGVINASGSIPVKTRVRDKRNRYSDWKTTNVTFLSYSKPAIYNVKAYRCVSSTNSTEDSKGKTIAVLFDANFASLNSKNSAKYTVAYRQIGTTEWTSKTISSSTYSITNGSYFINNADLNSSYEVKVTLEDDFNSVPALVTVSSGFQFMSWRAEGKGIAFGKTAEFDDTAEFEFDAKFNKPVYGKALGLDKLPAIPSGSNLNDYKDPGCWAVYKNADAEGISNMPVARAGRLEVWSATGEGASSEEYSYLRQRFVPYNSSNAVWERDITRGANNVWTYYDWWRSTLTPTASEKVYEKLMHEQKLLWGGGMTSGMYMTASHTATLTEPISDQPNGIVLVFCAYNGTSDTNYSWQSFFVPKQLVALSTAGHTFVLGRGKFTYTGTKYLYIYDTKIVGHADNNLTGSNNGITYANNKFVLRYVIGV